MKRLRRFQVTGRFTGGAPSRGTVTIDPNVGLFTVRQLYKQRKAELPLSAVAEFVVWHCAKMEVKEKKARKKKERLERHRARQSTSRIP